MQTKVFGVYDTKAKCYGQPFFMLATGAAVRAFGDLANDKQSSINKHPTDYVLFELGEFDDQTGIFTCVKNPTNLGLASDYIEKINPAITLPTVPADSSTSNGKAKLQEVK